MFRHVKCLIIIIISIAHCLHNIGLLFDMKKQHDRSLPHYEEALTIKNALAGFGDSQGSDFTLTDEKDNFILRCLDDNTELPVISKATLSTAMTHIRMASVYAKVCFFVFHLLSINSHGFNLLIFCCSPL